MQLNHPSTKWRKFGWLSLAISGIILMPITVRAVSPDDLKKALAVLSTLTVEIDGDFVAQDLNPVTNELEKTGYGKVATTVSLSGSPLMLHRQYPNALGFEDRKGSFFEFYSTIVNNGEYWLRAQDAQGQPGGPYADNLEATITKGVNPWVNGKDWITGVCYLFPFSKLGTRNQMPVLEAIKAGADSFKISTVTQNGEEYVVLDFSTQPYEEETFLLDPHHGFAMKEHRIVYNKGVGTLPEMVQSFAISEFIDAGHGAWLPKAAELTRLENGKLIRRFNFDVSKAVVLEGKSVNDIAQFRLTKGWHVRDERFGTAFTIGDTPTDIMKQYQAMIKTNEGK